MDGTSADLLLHMFLTKESAVFAMQRRSHRTLKWATGECVGRKSNAFLAFVEISSVQGQRTVSCTPHTGVTETTASPAWGPLILCPSPSLIPLGGEVSFIAVEWMGKQAARSCVFESRTAPTTESLRSSRRYCILLWSPPHSSFTGTTRSTSSSSRSLIYRWTEHFPSASPHQCSGWRTQMLPSLLQVAHLVPPGTIISSEARSRKLELGSSGSQISEA